MAYVIELRSSSILWDVISKTIIPVLSVILGVVVGYVLNFCRERRKDRKRLENIKKILLEELAENHKTITDFPPGASFEAIDATVGLLSCSVYDAYLGCLGDLETSELQKLFRAYLLTRQSKSGRTKHLNFLTPEQLTAFLEKTAEAIAEAMRLFDQGEQRLEEIQQAKSEKEEI